MPPIKSQKIIAKNIPDEKADLYRALYNASLDAIMTLEPPVWNFTSGNPAAVKMFRVKDEKQLATLKPEELSPIKQPDGEPSSAKAKKLITRAMKEGNLVFDWTHRRANGEDFPTLVILSKVRLNNKEFLQATVRDMSEFKKAEQELKERAAELEKMNKLMIGRELKMIELKEQIQKLTAKNNSKK
jgi:PAS domain S-box-containing protein